MHVGKQGKYHMEIQVKQPIFTKPLPSRGLPLTTKSEARIALAFNPMMKYKYRMSLFRKKGYFLFTAHFNHAPIGTFCLDW
jgi:hypothetical protein